MLMDSQHGSDDTERIPLAVPSVLARTTTALPHPRDHAPTPSGVLIDVVIPAFNEAERLPATVRTTVEYLARQPWSSRIVVVDNGSSDRTRAVAREAASGSAVPVRVIGCSRPGKGAAVRRGMLASRARFVGFFDADLATPVETLDAAVRHLQAGATAVIASRYAPGASLVRRQPLGRRLGGAAFRRLAGSLVPGVSDTQCGFKFFERSAVAAALAQCRTSGFAFDLELLQRLVGAGGQVIELPVAWTDQPSSTFRPVQDGLTSFTATLSLRRA